ncbi:hypothetical protein JB92DRAFT_2993439 [Gautieria morchelliformis]|nr:hypothetical protein JB92DRAFT_2993439 [Gautieria morchelliformis]
MGTNGDMAMSHFLFDPASTPPYFGSGLTQPQTCVTVSPSSQTQAFRHVIGDCSEKLDDWWYELFVEDVGRQQYRCRYPDCNHALFGRFDSARTHVRSGHFNHNGYICTCGQTYRLKGDADRHARTQNMGPSFPCQFCGLKLTRGYSKDKHEQNASANTSGGQRSYPPSRS